MEERDLDTLYDTYADDLLTMDYDELVKKYGESLAKNKFKSFIMKWNKGMNKDESYISYSSFEELLQAYDKLADKLRRIKKILIESNVLPAPNCKLFLEDGSKIVKIIDE